MKRFLLPSLLTLSALLCGWTFLVTNFFGIALDQVTFSAPGNNQSPVYSTAAGKWLVQAVVANDSRLLAPSQIGRVAVDTGIAVGYTAQGAANTLLHGTGNSTPTFSKLVDADITAGTITAGSLATAVTNRLMLTPSTVGAIEVDGGTGAVPVRLAQGAAGTILISQGAAANPAFTAASGDATISSGGVVTLASTISAAGPIGDSTHVAQITFDAKGRLTTVASVAIAGGGNTIALQNAGVGVTGSPASTLNATNGLTFGTVSGGVSALAPTYGNISNSIAQGNDTRFNAAPSAAGKLSVDTGSAWHSINAGGANTVLHGNAAADPTFGAVALADMATQAAKTVLANATNATAVPSAVGGSADQFFQINHANTALGFVTLSGDATLSDGVLTIAALAISTGKIAANAVTSGKVDSTVTISAGTNAKTGDQAYGNNAITGLKSTVYQGQSGDPASFPANATSFDTAKQALTIREVNASGGTLAASGAVGSTTADSTAIANTTAATNFSQTVTFPANFFTAGKTLRVTAIHAYGSTGSPTFQERLLFGSTAIVNTGTANALVTNSGQFSALRFVYLVTCRATGASGTFFGSGGAAGGFNNGNLGLETLGASSGGSTATIDTTASQTMNIEWTWSAASATNTIKLMQLLTEVLN